MYRLLTILIAFVALLPMRAQQDSTENVIIFFREGNGMLYKQYMGNEQRMLEMLDRIDIESLGDSCIRIDGYAPSNLRLAKERSNRVKTALIRLKGFSERNFITANHIGYFDYETDIVIVDFSKAVRQQPAPTSESGNKELSKDNVAHLRQLQHHGVDSLVIYDTIYADTVILDLPMPMEKTSGSQPPAANDSHSLKFQPATELKSEGKSLLAFKTNMLYDIAMTPNIEIERWLGRRGRWSVMAEWTFPWWQWKQKSRVYEVNEIGLELRLWMFKRKNLQHRPLTGHFLGLYFAGGYYDLEWNYKGEQGEFYSAGLTYGYSMRMSKHWNLELSLSAGGLYSPYTHYEAENSDNVLTPKYRKRLEYFGLTKLKVSFVWIIGR